MFGSSFRTLAVVLVSDFVYFFVVVVVISQCWFAKKRKKKKRLYDGSVSSGSSFRDFPIALSGSVSFLACCRISHVVFVFGQSLKL